MRVLERNRFEIEKKLEGMGEYVKMDYLSSCIRLNLGIDVKKFCTIKLAEIYESRGMFIEAARLYRNSADINSTYAGQKIDFLKACELFVKGGQFEDAETSYKKALISANKKDSDEIKSAVKEYFKTYAKSCLIKDKRRKALEAYERIYRDFDLDPREKEEVRQNILNLYEKLGKVKEYLALKKKI